MYECPCTVIKGDPMAEERKYITGGKHVSEEDLLRELKDKIAKKVDGRELKPGRMYVVFETKPRVSYLLLKDLLSAGKTAICVSRNNAERVMEEYGVQTELFIWLTGVAGKNNLPPTSIGILTRYLAEMIEKKPGCVVLIDCLDTLILNNKFPGVMRMIETLYDQLVKTNSILILPVMKEMFSQQDLAYLTRNAEVIE
ncbi:MAG: DUF835 domain-containing protein [Thermoplasmata archaeon]|nr:DUF835 domain-containing protein [Thermoplasmata archaeon]